MYPPGYNYFLFFYEAIGLVTYIMIYRWARKAVMSGQIVLRNRILAVFTLCLVTAVLVTYYAYYPLNPVLNWLFFLVFFSIFDLFPIYVLLRKKLINERTYNLIMTVLFFLMAFAIPLTVSYLYNLH